MEGTAGTTARDTEIRLPKVSNVKNKQPAAQQITAEQILREARELQEQDFKPPRQKISDPAELAEYRLRKRKEFEDLVRRVRWNLSVWVKYAQWEESQKDFRRARSVWERTLEVSYTNPSVWLKYAEMEMRHKFVNHARNVWDRAVTLLPRVDSLWYKYIHMEEVLGNVPGARQIFERWMAFEPDHHGWLAYLKMELRYNEVDRARAIFERYVVCLPTVQAWVRYARFEAQGGELALARRAYERAIEELGEDGQTEELYTKFAEFEERSKELERARAIYKYALDHIPKAQASSLYERFMAFEKRRGQREGIEEVVVSERRFQYEAEVAKNPYNYDAWFNYIRLEESAGSLEKVREVYERAVANVPPAAEKRYWQRFIYFWIKYALWEELAAEDIDRARAVYRACLNLIPHRQFTFAKVWMLAAKFEVRQQAINAARKLLGTALGLCPKGKLFRSYIELELQVGAVERVRTLYGKWLEWNPSGCAAWCKFAELERSLEEPQRARAVYELATGQSVLDMPELLWKAYIDFEIASSDRERTRQLYERLLTRTRHIKVWMSFAAFEAAPLPKAEDPPDRLSADEAPPERAARARSVYERAFHSLRESQPDAKEEAVMLLEAWRAFEAAGGENARGVAAVEKRMPKRVKRRRPIAEDAEAGEEEFYDYIFPDEGSAPNLKLLEAAQRWKRHQQEAGSKT